MKFGARYNRSMAADENKRKENFREFLDSLAERPNSQLIAEAKAKQIRKVLYYEAVPVRRRHVSAFMSKVKGSQWWTFHY